MNAPISLLLVDDHILLRDALAERLAAEPHFEVVGRASDAAEALRLAVETRPSAVVLDIDMPGLLAFDAARQIAARNPQTRVLFLSGFAHDQYVDDALRAGATGYVCKNEPYDTLRRAIEIVAGGGLYFSPDVQPRIVVDETGPRLAQRATSPHALTPRETEVMRYLARGMSQKEIAETMHLSANTVNCHCTNIMNRLNLHDRVSLVRYAINAGLATP